MTVTNAAPLLLTTSDVARRCDVTPDAVRVWARSGKLATAIRTPRGLRLFSPAAVERLLVERQDMKRGE